LVLKLDQLEMRAAVLERDARAAMRAASTVVASVGTITRLARGMFAWTLRTIVRARLNEAALSAAIAGLLLLSLLIALLIAAPPE
jgi:hypothetical protein